MKKRILYIVLVILVFAVLIKCYIKYQNENKYLEREKAVIYIKNDPTGKVAEVQEIDFSDCRDWIVDYDSDMQTFLYINLKNEIIEKSLETGSTKKLEFCDYVAESDIGNIQYGPDLQRISMVFDDELYTYDIQKEEFTGIAPCLQSTWRNTFLWKNLNEVFTLVNTPINQELYLYNLLDKGTKQIKGYFKCLIGMEGDTKLFAIQVDAKPHAFGFELIDKIVEINLKDGSIRELQRLDSDNYVVEYYNGNLYWVEQKSTARKFKVFRLNVDTGKKKCIYKTDKDIVGIVVE